MRSDCYDVWFSLQYFMHSNCSGVCLCAVLYVIISLVIVWVMLIALWLLFCLPVYHFVHFGLSCVCFCNLLCAMTALVLACVTQHALLGRTPKQPDGRKLTQANTTIIKEHAILSAQANTRTIRVHKIVHKHTQEQSTCIWYYTSNYKSNQKSPNRAHANTRAIKLHHKKNMAINMHELWHELSQTYRLQQSQCTNSDKHKR